MASDRRLSDPPAGPHRTHTSHRAKRRRQPSRNGERQPGRRTSGRDRDGHQRGDAQPERRADGRVRQLPIDQSATRHVCHHRGARRVLEIPARGNCFAGGQQFPGGHHDGDRRARRDGHRRRRSADARSDQAEQRPDDRRRVPERGAGRRGKILERLSDADAGRHLASAQRRERPPELFRQRRRASRRRHLDGRVVRRQLQRLQHQPNRPQLGSDSGHRGQDGRRRCRIPDGLRPRHQHGQQERRQSVPRHRRARLPAVPLEREQRDVGNAGHAASPSVRLGARRSNQERQNVVLRRDPLHRQQERHRPHARTARVSPGVLPRHSAGEQHDYGISAVGEGDDEAESESRSVAHLSGRSSAAERRRRGGLRAGGGAVDRRADVRRQARVDMGPTPHDDALRELQHEGRQQPR